MTAVGELGQTPLLLRRADLPLSTAFAPVEGETETRLMTLWQQALETGELGALDDFFELGGDSMMAASLFAAIEAEFNRRLPLSTLLRHPTVRSLATLLEPRVPLKVAHPLVPIREQGEGPPLILFHGIGGNVLFAHGLLPQLSPGQRVYAIQARGLLEGEPAHRRFETMAQDYAAAIRCAMPRGPYHLAGLCAGSFAALETARRLQAAGEQVALLAMLDPNLHPCDVPWIRWRYPDSPATRLWRAAARVAWLWRKRRLPPQPGRGVGPNPADGEAAVKDRVAMGFREAFKNYRPAPYDGQAILLMSEIQREEFRGCEAYSHRLARSVDVKVLGRSHWDVTSSSGSTLGVELQRLIDAAMMGSAQAPAG